MLITEKDEMPIVVGFDGSEGATTALKWAIGEAERHGASLKVVQAWTSGEFGNDAEQGEYTQEQLTKEVGRIMESESVRWDALAEHGSAGKILLEQAKTAQMLVVGSRGHGAFAGLALGSVGIQVATHEGAPVVVIVRQ